MAGIRIGGVLNIPVCSPPMTAYGGSGTDGTSRVYRSCTGDDPGDMTVVTATDFADSDQNSDPVLSPNGNGIVFTVLGASTGYDEVWYTPSAPGSTAVQLVADPSNYIWHPSFLDNSTFLYTHFAGGAFTGGGIYKDSISSPGSPTLLKAASGGFTGFRPQANFDGTRIAYIWAADAGTSASLRVMDADGTNDAEVVAGLNNYYFNNPPQFSWALTQNLIAYQEAGGAGDTYVIEDDGTGQTQLNANGDAAGVQCYVSHLAWAPADAFIVLSGDIALGDGIQPIRAEVDGSDTNVLGGTGFGPQNRNWFRGALVYQNRIWMIRRTNNVGVGEVQSMALDGTDTRTDFLSTAGPGDLVEPFGGGDGWYWN